MLGALDRHVDRSSLALETYQTWLMHYAPQVFQRIEQLRLAEKVQLWRRMAKLMRVPAEDVVTETALYARVCAALRTNYDDFLRIGTVDMLGLQGYGAIATRHSDGAYASMVNIGERDGVPCRLIGKVLLTYEGQSVEMSGACYNEVTLSRQVASARVIETCDVVVTGSVDPLLPMGAICLVQPRMGGNLCRALEQGRYHASPAHMIGAMMAIAEGVANIHHHQFVHLDLKPENILTGPDGPVICDFGLSYRVVTQRFLDACKVTSWYRPPELFEACIAKPAGEIALCEYGVEVDLWSLGMVFWDFLVTRPILAGIRPGRVETVPEQRAMLAELAIALRSPMRYAQPNLRASVAQMPEWLLTSLFGVVTDLLSVAPAQRPGATLVWQRLQVILQRCERGTSAPALTIAPLFEVGADEAEWRRVAVRRVEVESWWDRALKTIEWAERRMRPVMSATPRVSENPETYLDALVLACDLMLRMQYVQGDVALLFTDEQVHTACTCLAVQITRPWWTLQRLYDELATPVHKLQEVEQFVAHCLGYRLYAENPVTRARRDNPHVMPAYAAMRAAYLGEFID